jgi:ADP-dependent NAD(P)H-hydrate dehydratase / NAD(P)H-hydrate epimerase
MSSGRQSRPELDAVAFPPLLTVAQMRAADAAATSTLGVPSLLLMENAGRGVAEIARRELAGATDPRVAVVCGAGANGGDGFVAARHLALAGVSVRVLLAAPRDKIRGDAATMLAALERGVAVDDGSGWSERAKWTAAIAGADLLVDAVFGIGVRGAVGGVPGAAIAAMNAARAHKLAVDVPSGLDADSGRAAGEVFHAGITATMGARKLGLYLDADAPVGRVKVVSLGVPMVSSSDGGGERSFLLDEAGVAARLPRRRPTAHKTSSGHVLVVAGSPGKTGAAVLVGQAALRAGAGLVTLASTAAGQAALDAKVVELMTAAYGDGREPEPDAAVRALAALSARAQAVVIGPGIPTGDRMRDVVRRLASTAAQPMVIDADGLNALATDAPQVLAAAPAPRVLTPHPGEMGKLAGTSTSDVQADRLGHARRVAAATRAIVVLKGARTIVAAPGGDAFISPIACAALATAGSGDVLAGVIGALLARGCDALTAAQVAVYVHGAAGMDLEAGLGDGVAAGDLPRTIATVMARLQRGEDSGRPRAARSRPQVSRGRGARPRRPSLPRRRRRPRR